jgi:hypothetical protein
VSAIQSGRYGARATRGRAVGPDAYGIFHPTLIYFCLLHSPRHFLLTADQFRLTPLQGLRAAWSILMANLAIISLGIIVLAVFTPAFEPATLQIVFIGLAAVTVPHMLLTAVFRSVHP